MSNYTVMVKLSSRNENGAIITAGSVTSLSEGAMLGVQVANRMGYRGRIFITILNADNKNQVMSESDSFC